MLPVAPCRAGLPLDTGDRCSRVDSARSSNPTNPGGRYTQAIPSPTLPAPALAGQPAGSGWALVAGDLIQLVGMAAGC